MAKAGLAHPAPHSPSSPSHSPGLIPLHPWEPTSLPWALHALGLQDGWTGVISLGLARLGIPLPLTNQAVPGAMSQEGGGENNCHFPSPGQGSWPHLGVGGFCSGH